jgi:hypothetical protein
MFFHIEQRRAWLRSHTHTVVLDRDPDFARFVRDSTGMVQHMLRVWLAEQRGPRRHLHAYLGTVTCCASGPSLPELRRLLHLTTRAAATTGQPARVLRRHLIRTLRRHVRRQRAAAG